MDNGWSFTGRRGELRTVEELLAAAAGPPADREAPGGVVLAGAAGVGKTRLAREVLRRAAARGAAVHWAVATQGASGIPFGAVAALLPVAVEVRDPFGASRAIAAAVAARAAGRELLIGVDDAHLLDECSILLLRQLLAAGTARLLLTVRSERREPRPPAGWWQDGALRRVELHPFDRERTAELLHQVLGGQLAGLALDRVWQFSRGNALVLYELVQDALSTGALHRLGGVWSWDDRPLPGDRLADLVADRLGRIAPAEREVLELLALGEPLEPGLVRRLVPAAGLGAMEERGLLLVHQQDGERQLRIAHPLYGEVVRAGIGSLRAAELCERLAEAVEAADSESGPRRAGEELRVALWRLRGGDRTRPELYLRAARQVHAFQNASLAAQLAAAAMESGAKLEGGLLLAEVLAWQGRLEQADRLTAELAGLVGSDAERTRLALATAVSLFWGRGLAARAERVLLAAERAVEDRALRDELTALRAAVQLLDGRAPESVRTGQLVLDHADATAANLVRALTAVLPALVLCGRSTRALAWSGPARRALDGAPDAEPASRARLLTDLALAHAFAGELARADRIGREVYQQATAGREFMAAALAGVLLGCTALLAGDLPAARARLREAAVAFPELGATGPLPLALAGLAQVCAHTGELAEAEAALARAASALAAGNLAFEPLVVLAGAWLAQARGELTLAGEQALAAAESARRSGRHALEALALHDALRLGCTAPAVRLLPAAVALTDGPLAACYLDHALAVRADDGPRLDEVSLRFEEFGALLLAAEAAAEAAGAYERAGPARLAGRARARAAALAERCGGPATPALAACARPVALTRREREIAGLAAAGLSTRRIAERLTVSPRTVDGHLGNVFAKLGITGRAELAAALGGAPDRPA